MVMILRRFGRAKTGTSAVEFALIVPVLATLFIGAVELSRVVTASNRATFVAETLAQLVSQVDHTLTSDEISAFMMTSILVDPDILGYQRQSGKTVETSVNTTISSVVFTPKVAGCVADCTYNAAVVFSQRNNSDALLRACGQLQSAADGEAPSSTTLPASLYGPVSLVVVDVDVFIKPLFSFIYKDDIKFSRSAYFRPRLVDRVNSSFNCAGYGVTS